MSSPQRKSPASRSALGLTPQIESIVPQAAQTPAAAETINTVEPVSATPETLDAATAPQMVESSEVASPVKKTAPRAAQAKPETNEKQRVSETAVTTEKVTVAINSSLKRRAQTAVLRTAAYPEGHQTLVSLIESALARELEVLEQQFNRGKPFPENQSGFRSGRPFNS